MIIVLIIFKADETNSKEYHQQDTRQKAIQTAKGSFKGLNGRPGGLRNLSGKGYGNTLFLALDIVEAVDAQTNGAISNSINNGVDYLHNGIANGVNGFVERYQNGLNNIADVAVKNGLFGLLSASMGSLTTARRACKQPTHPLRCPI